MSYFHIYFILNIKVLKYNNIMDYYKVLEIPKSATKEDIKKAYHRLSIKYHPDRNNSPDANMKFQEINQANEILSNETKRKQYDMGILDTHGDVNIDDMLNGLFSNFMGNVRTPEVHVFTSAQPFGFFPQMPNMNTEHSEHAFFDNLCSQMMGIPPINKTVNISMEECYSGTTLKCSIERINQGRFHNKTENVTLNINIPAGINTNEEIVLEKQGHIMNSKYGDVHIRVIIDKHAYFEKQDMDLIYKCRISLKEALCGFRFSIEHLNGETLNLNHNGSSVIQPGSQKKITKYGFVNENQQGSLIIIFDVYFPEKLDENKIKTLNEIL